MMGLHFGRGWHGTDIEDGCPCIKAPCGLVAEVDESCGEHSFAASKTIRQGHLSSDCPDA